MISLDAHWHTLYLRHPLDRPTDGASVPSLLKFDARQVEGTTAWLEREFDLPMQEECVNYLLQIESVPVGTHLTLNGRDFGELTEALSVDVTDMVALEDNEIAFRVSHNAAGAFGAVRLVAVPCE